MLGNGGGGEKIPDPTVPVLSPEYTADWTTPHIPAWKEVLSQFIGAPNISAMEIGAFEGRSTRWFLENILTGKGSTIFVVDPFINAECPGTPTADPEHAEDRFLKNVYTDPKFQGRIQFAPYCSGHPPFCPPSFAYVDGSHRGFGIWAGLGHSANHCQKVPFWTNRRH